MSVSEFDEISGHADGDVPLTEPEVVHNLLLDGVTIIRMSMIIETGPQICTE
jgi:hypothetical protein